MSSQAAIPAKRRFGGLRALVVPVVILVVVAAMALDTKVVRIGSDEDVKADVFSAEAYGKAEFPRIQSLIEERAVDAQTLAAAIAADRKAAEAKYGIPSGIAPVFSVSLTGVVGEGKSGIYDVAVEGVPEELRIRVQTGPAINGTELRDATGTVEFGQFKNQIEYQDAGSALNNAMKQDVLAGVDNKALTGKTLSVVGAFRLINPKSWLVTPVRLSVQ